MELIDDLRMLKMDANDANDFVIVATALDGAPFDYVVGSCAERVAHIGFLRAINTACYGGMLDFSRLLVRPICCITDGLGGRSLFPRAHIPNSFGGRPPALSR